MCRMFIAFVAVIIAQVTFAVNSKLPDFVQKPVRALYLGDSLSDFDRGSNHVDKLQVKLDELSSRCVSIYNYAVRGDYIERVMERLRGGTNCTSRTAYHGIW